MLSCKGLHKEASIFAEMQTKNMYENGVRYCSLCEIKIIDTSIVVCPCCKARPRATTRNHRDRKKIRQTKATYY